MNKAVIYARYSSDNQNEQSIEGQLRVCQQYAQNNDTLIVDTYIDRAMTGTNDLRPAFQKMLKDSAKQQWKTTTWNMLSDKDNIRKIAESIFKIHESESKDNLTLKALEKERAIALKSSENLIKALEAGIITEQTKARLKELETRITGLDFDIEREKQRSYTYLTIPMIEAYLISIT